MADLPLITVYLVNHNYERFIIQSIESVLSQTYKNFELLIIDDGSTDSSRELINRFSAEPNITIVYQENLGLTVANNIAIRLANGKYIMRLDADDWLDSRSLEILCSTIERDSQCALVFPDYYIVDSNGAIISQYKRHSFDQVSLFDSPAHGACTLFRLSFLKEVGGYSEDYLCQDGFYMWLKLTELYTLKNVNLPLFFYRQHGSNLTSKTSRILDTRNLILTNQAISNYEPLHSICIIPVRGFAYDPRSIALEVLGSRTVLEWTISSAIASPLISHTIVDSPDPSIVEFVESLSIPSLTAILRPSCLAPFNTSVNETLQHGINAYLSNSISIPDVVVHLSIESPFRTKKSIDSAISSLQIFGTDIVVGVYPENDIFYQHNGNTLVALNDSGRLRLEREDIYREAGSIRVIRLNDGSLISTDLKVGHVVLDQLASFRITSPLDLHMARSFLHLLE